jgi:hypothetical protein
LRTITHRLTALFINGGKNNGPPAKRRAIVIYCQRSGREAARAADIERDADPIDHLGA